LSIEIVDFVDWRPISNSAISIPNPQSQSPIRNLNPQSTISILNPQSQSSIHNLNPQSTISILNPQSQSSIHNLNPQSTITKSAITNPQSAIELC
jgi:hypothetical protein